jgi:hypothetical protein
MVPFGPPFPGVGYATQADPATIAGLFPSGHYTLTATNSATLATQTVDIQYPNDFVLSSVPALKPGSFKALHRPNAAPLVIRFTSFTPDPRSTSSQEALNLVDFFGGPVVNFAPSLSPGDTSATVPAGFLKAGHLYSFYLTDSEFIADSSNGVPTTVAALASTSTGIISVAAVPEPTSWALLLIGFGAVGSALRRRGVAKQPDLEIS